MTTAGELRVWTIYWSPVEAPGRWVVRCWRVTDAPEPIPELDAIVAGSLDEARSHVPPDLCRIYRSAEDDPSVIETWI